MPLATKFLLLLGPSGVGKTLIAKGLRDMDRRYVYVSPYINRGLRDGETDKVSITDVAMDRMTAAGEFLIVNELFGFRYATPRQPILDAFSAGKFPLLDWPISRLSVMQEAFGDRLFVVYVEPPSLEVLADRLKIDGRDGDGGRLRSATAELEHYHCGEFDKHCNLKIVSVEGQVASHVAAIHTSYLASLDTS